MDGKPFAIIQRWLIADNADPDKNGRPTAKPMLAVTRLPPGPVCHVAYIDGQANRNPNELARAAADEFARDFKCGKDEVKVIGERGRAWNWQSGDTGRPYGVFERSMPSDLIRGWRPVRVKKHVKTRIRASVLI